MSRIFLRLWWRRDHLKDSAVVLNELDICRRGSCVVRAKGYNRRERHVEAPIEYREFRMDYTKYGHFCEWSI
jgi:hypothetical protein